MGSYQNHICADMESFCTATLLKKNSIAFQKINLAAVGIQGILGITVCSF